MLIKLFKYEFKKAFTKLFPFYILILVMPFLWEILGLSDSNYEPGFILAISIFIYSATAFVIFFLTTFMMFQKYNSSVYGNEGYLTNTLPVKSWQIILSKSLSIYFWGVISSLVGITSSIIIILFKFNFKLNNIFPEFIEAIKEEIGLLTTFDVLTIILFSIIVPILLILFILLCIGIGNQFSKKVIMGILAFIVITFVFNLIKDLIFPELEYERLFHWSSAKNNVLILKELSLNIFGIVVVFFLNKYLLDKRLNLD